MSTFWIQNARIIDPAAKRDTVGELYISDGKFVAALSAAAKKRAKKIDPPALLPAPA